jgi:hypothetical protein
MRNLRKIALFCLWILSTPAVAADPLPVDDPDQFSAEIISLLSERRTSEAATTLGRQIGRTDVADLVRFLKFFDDKIFDFNRKVIDKDYNGALRQIIYYAYIKGASNNGFMYFRFNYKMSKAGWLLTNFMFKDETQLMFPGDFTDR